jgi:hypothetical protein
MLCLGKTPGPDGLAGLLLLVPKEACVVGRLRRPLVVPKRQLVGVARDACLPT